MKKLWLLHLILPCLFLGAVVCSHQTSTGLGSDIINGIDSTITPVNANIQTFMDSILVESVFSMRDVGDSIPSGLTRNPTSLVAGRFPGQVAASNEEIISYLEFKPGIFRDPSYVSTRDNLKAAYSAGLIDSMVLRLERVRVTSIQGSLPKALIRAASCGILKDSTVFDRNTITTNGASDSTLDTTFGVSTDSIGSDTDYTIHLGTHYFDRIGKAVRDTAIDTSRFSFCLTPGSNEAGMVRFNSLSSDTLQPRIIIYYRASATSTSPRTVTLYRDHASYSVFESDSAAACSYAISSWATTRRAVLKLDLSSLRTFMDTAAPGIEKYYVIQRADLNVHIKKDSTDFTTDSVYVSFSVFDTLAHTLKSFTKTTSFYVLRNAAHDTTYILPLASYIQPLLVSSQPQTSVYVYLMIRTPAITNPPFVQINWDAAPKLKLKAIVTNPR